MGVLLSRHLPQSGCTCAASAPSAQTLRATSHLHASARSQRSRGLHVPAQALAGTEVDGGFEPLPLQNSIIQSGSNSYVKHCVRLRSSSKYRAEVNRCLLVGKELMRECAGGASGELRARVLFLPDSMAPKQAAAAGGSGRSTAARGTSSRASASRSDGLAPSTSGSGSAELHRDLSVCASATVFVSEAVMKKLTGLESVAGVEAVAELDLPAIVDFADAGALKAVQRLLALDRVQDPGNMGTLLRTAIAFGWDGVFMLPGCCDPFGDKAVRAGRGAALRVPIGRGSLEDLQRVVAARRMVMVAAEPEEQQAEAASSSGCGEEAEGGVCLVLGSEGQGLAPEVLAACKPVAIPMAGKQMESLNVGIAGGILMFMLSTGLPSLSQRLQHLGLLEQDRRPHR